MRSLKLRTMNAGRKRDRSVRSLIELRRTASTSRVLNLLEVWERADADPSITAAPFFRSLALNKSIIVKHRLRQDEFFLFDNYEPNATKVIIPFEKKDLGLGGQSVLIGQRGWMDMIREACNHASTVERDLDLLSVLDELPSLDPFLLREQLARNGHFPSAAYFSISESDLTKMQAYVAGEISALISLAYQTNSALGSVHTARLVSALLSNSLDARLEPLRVTLGLAGDSFREGVFSWKGFLYYKWMLSSMAPQLAKVSEEIAQLETTGSRDQELSDYITGAKRRLQRAILEHRQTVARALQVYDRAFRDLTHNGRPLAFREFLLSAPDMFVTLGEKVGLVAHIATFWRYRFPAGHRVSAPLEEAASILQEFEVSLGLEIMA